jgi:RNA polymerase sigma factor (sigma-70 family)
LSIGRIISAFQTLEQAVLIHNAHTMPLSGTKSSSVQASQETVLVEGDELDSCRQALASALSVLNNRERRIFEARRLTEEPITLKELADEFGVSRERVRQIDS